MEATKDDRHFTDIFNNLLGIKQDSWTKQLNQIKEDAAGLDMSLLWGTFDMPE